MRVSIEFDSYNPKRYSRPWGAKVSFVGSKIHYDFKAGNYLGDSDGGNVYIECEPGDIVAYGQRDGRGGNTQNTLAIVQADGSLKEVDKVEALEYWERRNAADADSEPENPLAAFSTEELLAELKRRGHQ